MDLSTYVRGFVDIRAKLIDIDAVSEVDRDIAKVMEDNSVALRLKELETLEKVTEKIGNISVYGGLDSVMSGLVRIQQ